MCPVSCKSGYRFNEKVRVVNVSCKLPLTERRKVAYWDFDNATACQAIKCKGVSLTRLGQLATSRCPGNKLGGRCLIKCKTGYTIDSTSNEKAITCEATNEFGAEWKTENAPVCREITCNDITGRENLEVFGNCGNSINTMCHLRCAVNHKFPSPWAKEDTLQAKCVIDGGGTTASWKTQRPRQTEFVPIPDNCEEIRCASTAMRGNYTTKTCGRASIDAACLLQCKDGFKFSDNSTDKEVLCTSNGDKKATWPSPGCIPITCPPPEIESNQKITDPDGCEGPRSLNSFCTIKCARNFKFISGTSKSSHRVQCRFNSATNSANWKPAPIPKCEAYKCKRQDIPKTKNYKTGSCPGEKSVDSMCPVSCISGYRFNEEVRAVNVSCKLPLTGRIVAYWDIDNATACQAIRCKGVSLTRLGHFATARCSEKKLGSRCLIKCKAGYTIDSTSNEKAITCEATNEFEAEWKIENAPVCREITCNDITGRENLEVFGNCGNSINTTCDLRCAVNHKFPSPWAKIDSLQAKCVIAGGGKTASWKTQRPRQTEFVSIPDNCEEILCNATAMGGNYATETCGSASINAVCQLQCKDGFKFSDNSTDKDVLCTSNGDKTATWPSPGCIQITCEDVTSSTFGKPSDNFTEKIPIPDVDCRQGSFCSLSCDKGYSLSRKTLRCNTMVEKWDPLPVDVGLCKPTIRHVNKCDYWISGFKTNSNVTANNHCRRVLGPTASLAMPANLENELAAWITDTKSILVGAYITGGLTYWNDGTRWKGLRKSRSVSFCVAYSKSRFSGCNCKSTKHTFMCERPKARYDPCSDGSGCNVGDCTAVGCSYRCTCPDHIYGRHCENGPFTINITTPTKETVRIYLKNNAKNETARYSMFLNGQEVNSSTLEEGKGVWKTHRLHQNERNNFISLVTSLVNRPDVSQSQCLIVKNPNGRDRVNITNDKCDPTVLNVFWEGFGENLGPSTNYSVYVGKARKGSSQAGSWIKLSGLKREKQYNIRVLPTIEGCKNYSLFDVRKGKTSYGGPDAPNITKPYLEPAQSSITQNCSIAWMVERPNNSAGYTVKFVEENRVTRNSSKEEFVMVAPFMSFHSFRTKPNSIYRISVSTKGPFGCDHVPEKWSNEVSGCETDTSAPSVIRNDLITVSQQNKFPRVILNHVDERNGPVSCYLVIVQVALSSSNSSKVATTINDLKQVNDSVNAGDNYIAIAVKRHEVGQLLYLGNGNMSCCNIRNGSAPCTLFSKQERQKRAASSEDNVRGENRPLDPNRNYRHYVLIATPRTHGGDPIVTASPLSDAWNIPRESDDGSISPMTIVFPIVIVILILAVIAGMILYRRRQSKRTNGKPFEANTDNIYEEPIEFVDLTDKSDSIIDEALSNLTFRLRDLFFTLKMKRENGDERFRHEFEKTIPEAVRKCELTRNIADMRVNQPKNRDRNVVPYDKSRVRVRNTHGSESADYINASYIDGYLVRRKYIATQGPKPETIADFWRMVLEQNCRVIVMLTTLKEKSKVILNAWKSDSADI